MVVSNLVDLSIDIAISTSPPATGATPTTVSGDAFDARLTDALATDTMAETTESEPVTDALAASLMVAAAAAIAAPVVDGAVDVTAAPTSTLGVTATPSVPLQSLLPIGLPAGPGVETPTDQAAGPSAAVPGGVIDAAASTPAATTIPAAELTPIVATSTRANGAAPTTAGEDSVATGRTPISGFIPAAPVTGATITGEITTPAGDPGAVTTGPVDGSAASITRTAPHSILTTPARRHAGDHDLAATAGAAVAPPTLDAVETVRDSPEAPADTTETSASPTTSARTEPTTNGAPAAHTATETAGPRPDTTGLPIASGDGAFAVDKVRYLRDLAPAREIQRLAIDLDDARIAVRMSAGATTVDIVSDPSSRLDAGWASSVEKTLRQIEAPVRTSADQGTNADARDGRQRQQDAHDEQHQRTLDEITLRRWSDAIATTRSN